MVPESNPPAACRLAGEAGRKGVKTSPPGSYTEAGGKGVNKEAGGKGLKHHHLALTRRQEGKG